MFTKESLLKEGEAPVVEKSNRRFIKLKAVSVLVIKVHISSFFVLLFIEL